MNRIDRLFARVRATGRPAFIPFITAGDPNLPTTQALALALLAEADRQQVPMLIELGFPYSDPIADGAAIQASYTRALNQGVRLDSILAMVAGLRAHTEAPLVAMVSYSLVFRNGVTAFLARLRDAGIDGAILPDLPMEEAASVEAFAKEFDFKIVHLVAPTTPAQRAQGIVRHGTGFVYCVAVTGITGERADLPPELGQRLAALRQWTDLPLCIGFGISKPEHVAMLRPIAEGVIVGSAIVRRLAELEPTLIPTQENLKPLVTFVGSLLAPLSDSP